MGVPAGDTCVLLVIGSARNVHLPVLELPGSKCGYQFISLAQYITRTGPGQATPRNLWTAQSPHKYPAYSQRRI